MNFRPIFEVITISEPELERLREVLSPGARPSSDTLYLGKTD